MSTINRILSLSSSLDSAVVGVFGIAAVLACCNIPFNGQIDRKLREETYGETAHAWFVRFMLHGFSFLQRIDPDDLLGCAPTLRQGSIYRHTARKNLEIPKPTTLPECEEIERRSGCSDKTGADECPMFPLQKRATEQLDELPLS